MYKERVARVIPLMLPIPQYLSSTSDKKKLPAAIESAILQMEAGYDVCVRGTLLVSDSVMTVVSDASDEVMSQIATGHLDLSKQKTKKVESLMMVYDSVYEHQLFRYTYERGPSGISFEKNPDLNGYSSTFFGGLLTYLYPKNRKHVVPDRDN